MQRESGSNQLVSRNVATLPHLLQGGGGIQESLVTVVIPVSAAPSNCGMTSHPTGMGWEGGWNQGAGCRLLLTLEEGTEAHNVLIRQCKVHAYLMSIQHFIMVHGV